MTTPDFHVNNHRSKESMNKITEAIHEMISMDELAQGNSFLHKIHPLSKLIVTILYIFIIVSFPINDLTGLMPLILYPVILAQLSNISIWTGLRKLRIILLLVCAVGIWNPILDREMMFQAGVITVTSGMISFLTLLIKGILALLASFYLIAVTGIEKLCYALSILRVPKVITTLILITYRYINLLLQEVESMMNAYSLRAPGQKGIHISTWGSFVGQLLIRSMDRANELYQSMELRGFQSSFYYVEIEKARKTDFWYVVIFACLIILCRRYNVTVIFGNLFV